MTVRVVRILEYYYDNLGQANADMRRWQVPASGEKQFGMGNQRYPLEIVRSSVLGPQQLSTANTADFHDAPIGSAVPQAWEPGTTADDFAYRQSVRAHGELAGVEGSEGFQEGRV